MHRMFARLTMVSVVVFLSVILGLVLTSCGGSGSQSGGSSFVGPPDLFPTATSSGSTSTGTAFAMSVPAGATANLVPLANRLLKGGAAARQPQNLVTTTSTTSSTTSSTTTTTDITTTDTVTATDVVTVTPTVTLSGATVTTTVPATTSTVVVPVTVTPTVVTTVTVPSSTVTATQTSIVTLRAQPAVAVTTTVTTGTTVTASPPVTVTAGPVSTVTVSGTDTIMTVTDTVTASPTTLTSTVTGGAATVTVNETSTVVSTPSNVAGATFVNNSGGQLTTQGVYTAGSRRNTLDVITYSSGQSSVVIYVAVASPLSITPGAVQLAPGGSTTFSTSGGSGTLQYSLYTNQSGASIDPATGAYKAGANADTVDLVQVRDGAGNVAYASVLVGTVLTVRPATADVAAGGALALTVAGNVGSPVFTSMVNASGCTVNAASGAYNAGMRTGVADIVIAGDQAGHLGISTINVKP